MLTKFPLAVRQPLSEFGIGWEDVVIPYQRNYEGTLIYRSTTCGFWSRGKTLSLKYLVTLLVKAFATLIDKVNSLIN